MSKLDNIQSAEVISDIGQVFDKMKASGVQRDYFDDDGRFKIRKETSALDSVTSLPQAEELQRLAEAVGIEWTSGMEDRVIPYWASDERPDRHGDIVRQRWNFKNFAKNPVIPYSHDWESPPIGNSIRWQVLRRIADDYDGPGLHLLNLFADEKTWAFADTIFRLIKAGFLKSSSVGFYPEIIIEVKDDKEREQLGLGRWGYIYDLNELLEHSPTTIPANPGAVSLLRSNKDLLRPHDIQVIRDFRRKSIQRGDGDSTRWKSEDASWRTIWASMFPEVHVSKHEDLDVPVALELPDRDTVAMCQEIRILSERFAELQKSVTLLSSIQQDIASVQESVDELSLKKPKSYHSVLDEETVKRAEKIANILQGVSK